MKPKQERQTYLTDSPSVNSVLIQLPWMGLSLWAYSLLSEKKTKWRNWSFISILKLFYISLNFEDAEKSSTKQEVFVRFVSST